MKLFTVLKNIWSIKELRDRILFTLGLLMVYRIGTFVVLPGVVPSALSKAAQSRGANDLRRLNRKGYRCHEKSFYYPASSQ